MSVEKNYASCDASLENLFVAAAGGDASALGELANVLNRADKLPKGQWAEEVQLFWQKGLELVCDKMDIKQLGDEARRLLAAMLNAEFDSVTMRDRYAALARQTFTYGDPMGLSDALCLRDTHVPMSAVAKAWAMMKVLKSGVRCHDIQLGLGTVIAVDDLNNEVQIQFERRKTLPLKTFFENNLLVKAPSFLNDLLAKKEVKRPETAAEYQAAVAESVLSLAPFDSKRIHAMLAASGMAESEITRLENGEQAARQAAAKPASRSASGNALRWDTSRSMLELSERLKNLTTLALSDAPNLDNVTTILTNASVRPDQCDRFSLALAILQHLADNEAAWLEQTIVKVAPDAHVWNHTDVYADITDKMPGKLVPFWFKVTLTARGAEYLAQNTLHLPYRLWIQTEKLLNDKDTKEILAQKVREALASARVSADLLLWLWKSKYQDMKDTYLSDAHLLFKTLQQEVRGNYLKAQRDMKHLLLDDESFQKQVMLQGDHSAVIGLVRCVKRLPLLDAGERQSLLVKIVRHYPQYIHDVEERHVTTQRRSVGKLTSLASYQRRKEELAHLINVLIPENIAAIEHARGYGDLRENSEFKFAKEQQVFLNNRRNELEDSLNETKTTTFADVEVTGVAIPGTCVELKYDEDGHTETFYLLGLFDGAPERKMIPYDTPLGKVLMWSKIGDTITMPAGDQVTISAITRLPDDMLAELAGTPEEE